MKTNIFKQESNYQDLIKVIAFIAMVIDHVGLFFFPNIVELRAIGRFAMPIFCFFAGYNFKNKIYWRVGISAAFFELFIYFIYRAYVPINILVPIFMGQVFLFFFARYLVSFDIILAQVIVMTSLYLVTDHLIENGTFTIAIMLLGFSAKKHLQTRKLAIFVMCASCFCNQVIPSYGHLFGPYNVIFIGLINIVTYVMLVYLPLNAGTGLRLNFISRNLLYLYVLQFAIILLLFRYWHSITSFINSFF